MDPIVVTIIVFVCVGIFIAFLALILMNRIASLLLKANFGQRYDDRHTLKYFTVDDFPSLKNKPIEFKSNEGQTLKGYLYSSKECEDYKALMIVSHGLGAGHIQYTTEINYFAQKGYLVLAFDDTGCNMSEGDGLKGFTQALIDLDYCLRFVDNNPKLNKLPKVLFGHSMGAYSVINVTSINKTDIKAIVSLAPFKDEASMLFEQFRAMTNVKMKYVYTFLKKKVAKTFNGLEKINAIYSLKNSNIPTLIIAGNLDNIVDIYSNFEIFKDVCKDKENDHFILVDGRYHRPNLALDAAKYDEETNVELQQLNGEYKGKAPKEKIDEFYQSLDYDLLVKMDDKVMNQIVEFIDSNINN